MPETPNLQKQFLELLRGYESSDGPRPREEVDKAFKSNPELATVMLPNNIRPIEMALNSKNLWISQKIAVIAQIKANPNTQAYNKEAKENFGTILADIKASHPSMPEWIVQSEAENKYLATFNKETKKIITPELTLYIQQIELEHWKSEENKKDALANAYNDKAEAAQNSGTDISGEQNPALLSPEVLFTKYLHRATVQDQTDIIDKLLIEHIRNDKITLGEHFNLETSQKDFTKTLDFAPQKSTSLFEPPLITAIMANSKNAITKLLDLKADPSYRCCSSSSPFFAYAVGCPAHFAAARGDLPLFKMLREKGASLEDENQRGDTPLDTAVMASETEIVNYCIEQNKAAYLKSSDPAVKLKFQTYLDQALRKATTPEMVKLLIKAGANVNAHSAETGNTALHRLFFYESNSLRILGRDNIKIDYAGVYKELMRHGADVNAVDQYNQPPLYSAITYEADPAIISDLVERTTDLTKKIKSTSDGTVLHLAEIYNNLEAAKYILKKNPSLAKRTDNQGNTALHDAARMNKLAMVTLLMPYSNRNAQNQDGDTALHMAAYNINYHFQKPENKQSVIEMIKLLRTDENIHMKGSEQEGGGYRTPVEYLRDALNKYGQEVFPVTSEPSTIPITAQEIQQLKYRQSALEAILEPVDYLKRAVSAVMGAAAAGVVEAKAPPELLPMPRVLADKLLKTAR